MAVSRREKNNDSKYSVAIGARPSLDNREPELADVIEDLRDDVNELADLANIIDGFTLAYKAAVGRTLATLTITHTSSRKTFIINASS
tara:strand:+ start:401 stop:664 length:264 start_codon:yes stop_codon:yes gene_type:complete